MTKEDTQCKCNFTQKMVGDGCDVCNPEKAKEYQEDTQELMPGEIWLSDEKWHGYHETQEDTYQTKYIRADLVARKDKLIRAQKEELEHLRHTPDIEQVIETVDGLIKEFEHAKGHATKVYELFFFDAIMAICDRYKEKLKGK